MPSGAAARSASATATGSSAGQPAVPSQAGRRMASGDVPCASMSEVTVSAPTHVIAAGQTSAACVPVTAARATSTPRRI
jgi:hypothetical protein